ncbi:hypothetical protein [Ramlibacter sp.]|uniref:hypothetical protein n=1 Tax=Ramlibacter sp. TaxID=1917967 RepID=UPI0035B0B4FD
MPDFNLDTTEKVISVIAGLLAIFGAFRFLKRRSANASPPASRQPASATQTVSVNVGNSAIASASIGAGEHSQADIAELKRTINLLFIDDDRAFKIVSVLRKMGWEHTKLVTDVNSLEQPALLEAHVVFVDIQGVGKAMQYADEGLGLAQAIKRRHPTKRVVIYSAEENGARFHEALREADYCLPKTAEPIRFEDTIVKVLRK